MIIPSRTLTANVGRRFKLNKVVKETTPVISAAALEVYLVDSQSIKAEKISTSTEVIKCWITNKGTQSNSPAYQRQPKRKIQSHFFRLSDRYIPLAHLVCSVPPTLPITHRALLMLQKLCSQKSLPEAQATIRAIEQNTTFCITAAICSMFCKGKGNHMSCNVFYLNNCKTLFTSYNICSISALLQCLL